jgi:chromate transporter
MKKLAWLFGVNFYISMFTFGGGYVVVPMIRRYFVQRKRIFQEDELLEMAAVAQSSPGAIAVNLAALAGYRTAGTKGAVVSTAAAILPPFLILGAVSIWYDAFRQNVWIGRALKGMEAGVAAVIADLVADLMAGIRKEKNKVFSWMAPTVFAASFFLHINVLPVLAVCAAVSLYAGWKGGWEL